MTWRLDQQPSPEVLREASFALAVASATCVMLVRNWRERRQKSRQAAVRLAWQPDACDPIIGHEGEPIRMTLLADVHQPGAVDEAEAWLRTHRDRLTYLSEQGGCGCCIVDWDMEGPREVIETLPNRLRCDSSWTWGKRS